MVMGKSIIIVGAGIAGLSSGCYAQMNGYSTSIYEMHSIPGGLCTAWKRKGFTFDISMHMLTASVSGPLHAMWEELGVIKDFKFHFHDHMSYIEGMGKKLNFCTDRKKLEEQMLAISPEDSKLIKEFLDLIFGPDMLGASSLKPSEMKSLVDKMKMMIAVLPLIRVFTKYNNVTIQDFAARFKDPFLREAARLFVDAPGWPMPQFPMIVLAGFMQSGVTKAGVPLGGSQQVAFHIADLYKQLGGEIHFNSRVSGLIIENDQVKGIKLNDGSEHRADYVIWAGDGHTLIFDMLGKKYMDERIRDMYDNWIPVKPIVHVMLGVNRDMSSEPHRLILELDKPIRIGERDNRWMSVLHHSFDPSMAPAGKSVVEVWFDTEFDYWENLSKDKEKYKAEKQRIAELSIARLEKRWPGITSQIEVTDVPTPMTYKRYTGNWQGSPDGWYLTPANMSALESFRTLPGLGGLFMAGQWTAPFTGTVIASLSGRQLIQVMCRQDGKKFVTRKVWN